LLSLFLSPGYILLGHSLLWLTAIHLLADEQLYCLCILNLDQVLLLILLRLSLLKKFLFTLFFQLLFFLLQLLDFAFLNLFVCRREIALEFLRDFVAEDFNEDSSKFHLNVVLLLCQGGLASVRMDRGHGSPAQTSEEEFFSNLLSVVWMLQVGCFFQCVHAQAVQLKLWLCA
jgi:hypothetical protein